MLWLWSVAATDTAISLVLCVSLWRKKAGSGHRTGNLVNRIIRFSLGTALVTALNAVLAAVLYLVFLDDIRVGLCNIFVTPLPSVYVATLLYALSGWGRSSMPARAGSDPEKAEMSSCRFAKALRGCRRTREDRKEEQVDTVSTSSSNDRAIHKVLNAASLVKGRRLEPSSAADPARPRNAAV